jgi:transposase-like protein
MRRYTESERRQAVRDFERSGITAAEFCRRRGMSSVSLGQWRRRYTGKPCGDPAADAAWLPVVVSGGLIPEPEQRAVYVMITRACRLEVSPGFNPQEVRSLWEILRSIEEQPIHSQP